MNPSSQFLLSVLINTLNDSLECAATIRSILDTAPDKELEIIVIDDCSDIPFVISADKLDARVHIHRSATRLGCGKSRHLAAELATGDYLLIVDCHMRFAPGWYEAAQERIVGKPNTIYCACCRQLSEGNMDLILEETPVPFESLPVGAKLLYTVGAQRHFGKKLSGTQVEYECDEPPSPGAIAIGQRKRVKVVEIVPHGEMVIRPVSGLYTGATLCIYGEDKNKPGSFQVFEGKWKDHKKMIAGPDGKPVPGPEIDDDCELACMMGACYFVPRELFFRLGGLKSLKEWGSDEPLLSVKAWLSGCDVRLLGTVHIGHKFKERQPFSVQLASVVYNKLRSLMTLFDEAEFAFLSSKIPQEFIPQPGGRQYSVYGDAMNQIIADREEIRLEKEANAKLFVHDLRWLCHKFSLPYPLD